MTSWWCVAAPPLAAYRWVQPRPGSRVGRGRSDPVAAAAIAAGDVRLALHVRPEDLTEQVQLRLACRPVHRRDVVDRAVPFDEADGPVGADDRFGEVPEVVLDDRQLAGAIRERGIVGQTLGEPFADPLTGEAAALVEDRSHQLVAADRADRGQQPVGEAVVVGREQLLGRFGHVVDVPRATDPVADGLATYQAGCLERAKLLEDAGAAYPQAPGEGLWRAGAIEPEPQQ